MLRGSSIIYKLESTKNQSLIDGKHRKREMMDPSMFGRSGQISRATSPELPLYGSVPSPNTISGTAKRNQDSHSDAATPIPLSRSAAEKENVTPVSRPRPSSTGSGRKIFPCRRLSGATDRPKNSRLTSASGSTSCGDTRIALKIVPQSTVNRSLPRNSFAENKSVRDSQDDLEEESEEATQSEEVEEESEEEESEEESEEEALKSLPAKRGQARNDAGTKILLTETNQLLTALMSR